MLLPVILADNNIGINIENITVMDKFSKTVSGQDFDQSKKDKVWSKGIPVPNDTSERRFRRDKCGALIKYEEYGKETTQGWEIDHIIPVSKGGTDDISNLQPLHWENNRFKADKYPEDNYCIVNK